MAPLARKNSLQIAQFYLYRPGKTVYNKICSDNYLVPGENALHRQRLPIPLFAFSLRPEVYGVFFRAALGRFLSYDTLATLEAFLQVIP